MDWRKRFDAAKTTAGNVQQKGAEFATEAIDRYWPTIRDVLRTRLGAAVAGMTHDDDVMRCVAGHLHESLPLPIRLVVRPHHLSAWCLSNRDRIIEAVRSGPGQPGAHERPDSDPIG